MRDRSKDWSIRICLGGIDIFRVTHIVPRIDNSAKSNQAGVGNDAQIDLVET